MTAAIVLNIFFAALVVTGIVSLLSWAIVSDRARVKRVAGVRAAPARARATPPAAVRPSFGRAWDPAA